MKRFRLTFLHPVQGPQEWLVATTPERAAHMAKIVENRWGCDVTLQEA